MIAAASAGKKQTFSDRYRSRVNYISVIVAIVASGITLALFSVFCKTIVFPIQAEPPLTFCDGQNN